MGDILEESAVTKERLEGLFKSAFMRAERDKDNDLVIRDESGVNTFVKVDPEKKLITYFSIWGLKASVPEATKLKFANMLNDDLVLVRFAVPRPTILWCDYQFTFEGGLIPFHVIRSYRRFVSVCKGAAERDKDDIIGHD